MTKQNSIFNVESYLEMILKDAFFYFMRFSFNKKKSTNYNNCNVSERPVADPGRGPRDPPPLIFRPN